MTSLALAVALLFVSGMMLFSAANLLLVKNLFKQVGYHWLWIVPTSGLLSFGLMFVIFRTLARLN